MLHRHNASPRVRWDERRPCIVHGRGFGGLCAAPDAVAGLDVQVIDFTAPGHGEGLNHTVPATSPAAITVLRGLIDAARSGQSAFEDCMVLKARP